jgi:hypothetical protein
MFARDTYSPTYSGPFMATGESLSRAKSTAGANRSFVGNDRAYRPVNQGVRVGSKGSVYRAGLLGDASAAQAGDHNAAAMGRVMDDAQSRMAFQMNRAEEQDGLRRLLFDTDQTRNMAENALRKDMSYTNLSQQQRDAQRRMGQLSRDTGFFGWLGGIFS